MKTVDFLLDCLAANGARIVFGNPGTTEIPLVRACEQRSDMQYVVALSEVAAVPMADGYARATGSLGVVNLHVAPGLGNGTGALYTAGIAGTPLLVLIGGQDTRFLHTDPILSGPLEQMARSVCKAVYTLQSTFDAASNVRRALRAALTPPYAPVALVCPPDVLEDSIQDAKPGAVMPPRLSSLSGDALHDYVQFVASAERLAIIAAEDVHWSAASAELQTLASTLCAPVYAAPYTGVLPIDAGATSYAGYLPASFSQISDRLRAHDALLFVGGRGLRTTLFSKPELPQRKAWLGTDANVQVAGDAEFALAYAVDLAGSLRALNESLSPRPQQDGRPARSPLDLPSPTERLHPTRALATLLERFRDAMWFDESGLSTSDVRQWMQLRAGCYFANGSGGIGWGLAASMGAAIGCRDRKIVAAIGDGSSLYASEAMWTGARHGADVLLVILSNRRYATLNEAAERLAGGALEAFTIEPPILDFSGLARLHGWRFHRVRTQTELEALIAQPDALKGPTLLELELDPALKPVTAARHF